jgi:hypothetical protein
MRAASSCFPATVIHTFVTRSLPPLSDHALVVRLGQAALDETDYNFDWDLVSCEGGLGAAV